MKMRKRLAAVLLSVWMLLMLMPSVSAAGNIDLEHDVSLTVSYRDGKTPLTGVQFDIYYVAEVDAYGNFTPTDPFAQFHVNITGKNDAAWKALASTLEGYVLRDGVTPTDSGKTGVYGTVSFPTGKKSLRAGLYLVLGQRHVQDGRIYEAAPFMVMLPALDAKENVWVYDVTAVPKYDSDPIPTEPVTVTRKVLKVWEDDGHKNERPKRIVVQLLRDGKVWDTVTLTAANNWRYTWTGLDSGHRWTVVEKELDGYTVEVAREGITYVITNTYTEEDEPEPIVPDKPSPDTPDIPTGPPSEPDYPAKPESKPSGPKLPQTGQLWWPVPALTAAGLLLIIWGLLRRRGAGNEK